MKRNTNTKLYIEEALIKLLRIKQLNEITVSDIVKTAGVARATFYRNYFDINEVIDCCFNDFFEEIFEELDSNNVYESVYYNFKKIKENREFFEIMKKQKLLYKINETIYSRTLRDINKLNVLNNRYQPYFFAGASSFMIEAWIENGFEEDEETMAKIFFESLAGYMKVN